MGITAGEKRGEGVAGADEEARRGADGAVELGEQTVWRRHGGTYAGDGGVDGAGVGITAGELRAEGVGGTAERLR